MYLDSLILACICLAAPPATAPAGEERQDEIRLVVRADDMGSSHAANVACIQAYREGIVRTVEVMVPGPWFNEAVRLLAEHPQLDVGVHLTLTSEWEDCKWGPITRAPSLADGRGHFLPMTSQRPDFPAGTGFIEAHPDLREVERELRAQIEIARKAIPRISHLTCHMGTATATPALRELTTRLSREYRLPLKLEGARPAGGLGGPDASPEDKEAVLVRTIEHLRPGLWLLVDHPGLDTPEMQTLGHTGYRNVAADRAAVTHAFCSKRVREAIASRGIRLISYAQALQERSAARSTTARSSPSGAR